MKKLMKLTSQRLSKVALPEFGLRWDKYGGFLSISLFGYDRKPDDIYFKTKAK